MTFIHAVCNSITRHLLLALAKVCLLLGGLYAGSSLAETVLKQTIQANPVAINYPQFSPSASSAKLTSASSALALSAPALSVPSLASEINSSKATTPSLSNYPGTEPDILAISDDIKLILDKQIRPIRDRVARARALHYLMFAQEKWAIDYSSDRSYTAQQTYDLRRGNCISMASLYIAAARYVNLNAKYQTVQVPTTWNKKIDYYVIPGHINVVVILPKQRVHIEFLRTFFDTDIITTKTKTITDDMGFAEFHNNLAMEIVESQDYALAKKHLDISLTHYDKFDHVWSNYGVVDKFSGDYDQAEEKYRKSLTLNKRNLSTLKNFYSLLMLVGKTSEAEKISQKVIRYSMKNPYYIANLAEKSLDDGDTEAALKWINKAIRKDKSTPEFYHLQARIYYAQDNLSKAIKALENARDSSTEVEDSIRYGRKVDALLGAL